MTNNYLGINFTNIFHWVLSKLKIGTILFLKNTYFCPGTKSPNPMVVKVIKQK